MEIKEYIYNKILDKLGIIKYDSTTVDKLTFVNNVNDIIRLNLQAYNTWYSGDDGELLNFYTNNMAISYNYEPYYNRNQKNYYWAISATEGDIKRTHSGHPRNIIDTIINLVGESKIEYEGEIYTKVIDKILEDNEFQDILTQEQMPFTLVEGWGCYKINWDMNISDTPIILYYKADDVDFMYKSKRLVGIIFKDYYRAKDGKKYLITETRYIGKDKNSGKKSLFIEKDLFEVMADELYIIPRKFSEVEDFCQVDKEIEIEGYDKLLAVPSVFFKDRRFDMMYGRSVFAGKLALFDDIDQVWSQLSSGVRKCTPIEYFDINFLERDRKTGMPIQPRAYDRKFVLYNGSKSVDGSNAGKDPVQVTQPDIRFTEMVNVVRELLINSVSGVLSPATLGIDVARKDNADAQREKEKVSIFTRKAIIVKQARIIKNLIEQSVDAYFLMRNEGSKIASEGYGVSVKFAEFADDSYENRLKIIGGAWKDGVISPEMAVNKLYSEGELTDEEKQREIEYMKEQKKNPFADLEGGSFDGE